MPNNIKYTRLEQLAGLPVEALLMHRNPMLLLDTLVEAFEESTICEFRISEGWSFVVPGTGVPGYIGIEVMGQCVAAHAGARARLEGFGPPLGFFLGTRYFKSSVDWLEINKTYRVTCKELFRDTHGMGSYDCSISLHELPVATARLTVLEKERGEQLSA
jgi:predicted hotdog family 3-hydroxylacyl-ACP dehydratase